MNTSTVSETIYPGDIVALINHCERNACRDDNGGCTTPHNESEWRIIKRGTRPSEYITEEQAKAIAQNVYTEDLRAELEGCFEHGGHVGIVVVNDLQRFAYYFVDFSWDQPYEDDDRGAKGLQWQKKVCQELQANHPTGWIYVETKYRNGFDYCPVAIVPSLGRRIDTEK